ncbi:MAG: penicillin-binding protein [Herminiimonas sp.]|nr:penicillin-binding protein [Herminiimonas sp.]
MNLDEQVDAAGRGKHWIRRRVVAAGRRIAGYFRATANPALATSARIFSGVKGLASLGLIGIALLCAYALALIPFTPSISDLKKQKTDQPSLLISADGKRLATFNRINRDWVEMNRISPNVIKALIATEDHRFYEHHGVDLQRTAVAAARALIGGSEGGSTITQQLARNLYPEEIGRSRSVTRKIKEIITALKIEHAYTKQEILETYLNTVPFLYNAFGIEMAARTYFDKPAARLNVLESATLIGMLKGTSYYNPVLNPERAVKRRNVVLSQMLKRKVLSQANFNTLKTRPIRLDFERQQEPLGAAPHFAEHVRKWLIDWADRNDYNIYSDGLMVYTTVDSRLQAAANQAVNRQMEALQAVADVEWGLSSERLVSTSTGPYVSMRRRVQPFGYFWNSRDGVVDAFIRESGAYRNAVEAGTAPDAVLAQLRKDKDFMAKLRAEKTRLETGFVAMDPRSGHIKAWVGSRGFATDQYDHVARAQRQPGSTFKPIVYGAALEQGMSPERQFIDQAMEFRIGKNDIWRPTDLSAPSGRPMTVREGLIYSKNTITAQIMQEVGAGKSIRLARKMGVNQSRLEAVPALALGASAVTPLEMVSAYSTIAGGGAYRKPVFITRIADKGGNVLAEFQTEESRAMSSETSEELVDMMRGVVNQGTGQAVRSRFGLRADVAGKTGTTQNNTDGWFILMHPQLVAGSWVGFNDTRITMRSSYWGQGAHNALFVVGDFFQQALNTRLLDGGVRFPGGRDSLFGPFMNRVDEWFGRRAPAPAPVPAPAPEREEHFDTPIDELERVIEQAREMERTYERERRRVERVLEEGSRVIESFGGRREPPPRD